MERPPEPSAFIRDGMSRPSGPTTRSVPARVDYLSARTTRSFSRNTVVLPNLVGLDETRSGRCPSPILDQTSSIVTTPDGPVMDSWNPCE